MRLTTYSAYFAASLFASIFWAYRILASDFSDVHILLYGDAGRASSNQSLVGKGMANADLETRFDIALSLGDNQYIGKGSEVMKAIFENPYKTLIKRGLVFYQTIGNHDMEFKRHVAQLKYSADQDVIAREVGGWALPAEDYVIKNINMRFVVTNTSKADGEVNLPSSRLKWIESQLCAAKEQWVFLVMHYPLWSSNKHGDNPELQKALTPVMTQCPPDALLAGHDHGGEVIRTPLGLRQFVVGNGAEARMPEGSTTGTSEWRYGEIGFATLTVSGNLARMSFQNSSGRSVHSVEWGPTLRDGVAE